MLPCRCAEQAVSGERHRFEWYRAHRNGRGRFRLPGRSARSGGAEAAWLGGRDSRGAELPAGCSSREQGSNAQRHGEAFAAMGDGARGARLRCCGGRRCGGCWGWSREGARGTLTSLRPLPTARIGFLPARIGMDSTSEGSVSLPYKHPALRRVSTTLRQSAKKFTEYWCLVSPQVC